MKMWIARTEGNVLTLHQSKPRRVKISHCSNEFFWASDVDTQSFLNKNLFPEVTFENSPMEVELTLKQAGSRREETQFDFKQCWTCESLIYDLDKGYICTKTNQQFVKREIVQPTDCEEWKRG